MTEEQREAARIVHEAARSLNEAAKLARSFGLKVAAEVLYVGTLEQPEEQLLQVEVSLPIGPEGGA